jgi:hypothetical protein
MCTRAVDFKTRVLVCDHLEEKKQSMMIECLAAMEEEEEVVY